MQIGSVSNTYTPAVANPQGTPPPAPPPQHDDHHDKNGIQGDTTNTTGASTGNQQLNVIT